MLTHRSETELRLDLALDGTSGGEIFRIYSSVKMAVYAIEITKLEVNGN